MTVRPHRNAWRNKVENKVQTPAVYDEIYLTVQDDAWIFNPQYT